ncbi:uncharacterized protein LOC116428035 [Nomia melanderi]|uniref:uncharacterized protein LOC116428035 n=1 Tax=Nomia melanderi TaxID=2448451 RepID=UPI003FCD0F0B
MSRSILINLIISGIGVIVGISACIVFFAIYGNHDVGFWSLLSGILAATCFHLHWVKKNETLGRWHSKVSLRNLHVVGFLNAVGGIAAMIWYLFLTFYYHIPIEPLSHSMSISAVYAMISGKWGILLAYHSHKYELMIQEDSTPILTESNA